MILIYAENVSRRLKYTCAFIFEAQLQTAYEITDRIETFNAYPGCRLNYSPQHVTGSFQILPAGLMDEEGIHSTDVPAEGEGADCLLFPNDSDNAGFDLFSAVFYLLARYEEYLPHAKDEYGRYAYENSIAFRKKFLHLPLINIWLKTFGNILRSFFAEQAATGCVIPQPGFRFTPTYDIDLAYARKGKSAARRVLRLLRYPSADEFFGLFGLRKDPFDSYGFLDRLSRQYKLSPVYFFLAAQRRGKLDKNIPTHSRAFRELLTVVAKDYEIGVHPSRQSHDVSQLVLSEKKVLESIAKKTIDKSRAHYIMNSLPHSYYTLLEAGIKEDYSMGYGSINGFRASVASPFFWYDLAAGEATTLRIHPFCFMDANCFYEQKLSVSESFEELMNYYRTVRNAGGELITIFHNNFFGTTPEFAGWTEMYEGFLQLVSAENGGLK